MSKGKEKSRRCPLCNKVFNSTSKLEKHLDDHEKKEPAPPPNPPGGTAEMWDRL